MQKLNQLKFNRFIALLLTFLLNNSLIYAQHEEFHSINPDTTDSRFAIVNTNGINIRQYPDIYSKILGKVNQYDVLIVTGKYKKWYRIRYKNQTAWIYFMYIEGFNFEKLPKIDAFTSEDLFRRQIVDYAKQFIGAPYQYGGTCLETGVDCSGFTQAVMKNFDISLNRSSIEQIKNGISIQKEKLHPADLVFFDTSGNNNGKISHVGLYIGNNRFIHATTSKGVKIDNLSQSYYEHTYVRATSVIHMK